MGMVRSRRALPFVVVALLAAVPPSAAQGTPLLAEACFDDPAGDAASPQEDIVEHCIATSTSGARFTVRFAAAPSQPHAIWDFVPRNARVIAEVDEATGVLSATTASFFDRSVVCADLPGEIDGTELLVPFVPSTCLIGGNRAVEVDVETASDRAPDAVEGEDAVDGPVHAPPIGVVRLEAADAVGAALALSRGTFPDDAVRWALLARDDVFADTLAAGGVVASGFVPLLLTDTDVLSPGVVEELRRLGAEAVTVVGGTAAVSPAVVGDLEAQGFAVRRIAGPTRIETAVAVARAFRQRPEDGRAGYGRGTILVRAYDAGDATQAFADAIGMGGLPGRQRWPVVLTETDVLSAATEEHLLGVADGRVVVVGSEAAVGSAVEQRLVELGVPVERIEGATRFHTNVEAIGFEGGLETSFDVERVVVVEGQGPDAWAPGFAAIANAALGDRFALVLTNGPQVPEPVAAWLSSGPPASPPEVLCAPFVHADACATVAGLVGAA